jgi:4-amino-4-deoxy-L-arabinose transferase-like glycosyltransferase
MILQNKTVMQMFFESERRSLIFLSLLWIGAVIFVNPIGEFPLNDDSIYAHWPKSIVENTSSQINGLLAPNLMLQAAWGALICQLTGGFSLTALRFSTLLLGWLNIFIVFGWAKAVSKGKISALLITAALVFNPVYFSLCHTFMTDVPFLVISNVALWLYFIYFQKRLEPYRWGAILIASLAFGIRQPAILLIFFFEIGIFLSSPKKMKSWIQLVFGVVWCVGLYVGVATVIKPYFGIQNAYLPVAAGFFDLLTNETGLFIFQLSKRTLMTIFHFGLFALPFMIPFFKHIKPEKWLQWHFFGPILLFNIAVILTLMQIDYYFPYSRAIFFNWG